jgi:hypothetical protein
VDETAKGKLLSQFQLPSPPARALAAETLKLVRTLSDIVNRGHGGQPEFRHKPEQATLSSSHDVGYPANNLLSTC